jgi:DNA-binding CsgD family transcriptional regulator/tetratricopeptide (TPR) repeat protein
MSLSFECVGLVGRADECTQIDELLDSIRNGLSGALVVRGEAGVGKTALLDYAVNRADGFEIVRLTGVEPERDLGFAALHRLLAPMLDQIGQLPSVQRNALNSALGLTAGPPANPFLVGLAVISMTAIAADADGPALYVVDDAQWVDSESIAALAFWARRLQADRIGVIFGERSDTMTASPVQGPPVLELNGLGYDEAQALLASAAGFELDRDVADRVLAETEGNPLAIIEVAKSLTPQKLVGLAAAPHPLPLSRRLEERFAEEVRTLPTDTRMFLLLVAADTSGDAALVWEAAGRLGFGREAAEAAEAADLVSLASPITYRHPLIRSAVYGPARPADRRAVHGALAAASDEADVERWTWHRAGAAIGPDEEIASLLESCAERASSSGATSAAVALLSRSAELTPDREQAAERRVAAAEAAVERGSSGQARTLVQQGAPALRDSAWRARVERVRGLCDLTDGNLIGAASRLRLAAEGLLPTDPVLGRRTLLEAVSIAATGGDAAEGEFMRSVSATDPHPPTARSSVVDWLLHAFSTRARAGYAAAVPQYRKAIEACRDAQPREFAPWITLIAAVRGSVWDDGACDLVIQRVIDWSRSNGALRPLCVALLSQAGAAIWRGQLQLSSALYAEASDVLSAAQHFAPPGIDVNLDAVTGRGAELLSKVSPALEGMGTGQWGIAYTCHTAMLNFEIGRARYEDALHHARVLFDADPMLAVPHRLPDMIEAAVRVGDRTAAEEALARLAERASAAGTPWALGLLARSRALMAGAGASAEEQYKSALELLGATSIELERARAHLIYGEWLRRARRHVDARDHLRRAHEMFATMGAEGFAERARVELLATGERAPKRTAETRNDLTPREAQVSRLVGQGATNREIAAQLFISEATVEYHLNKVFRKLGVKSRTQLARRVLEQDPPA